jgi:hypothetical protein
VSIIELGCFGFYFLFDIEVLVSNFWVLILVDICRGDRVRNQIWVDLELDLWIRWLI